VDALRYPQVSLGATSIPSLLLFINSGIGIGAFVGSGLQPSSDSALLPIALVAFRLGNATPDTKVTNNAKNRNRT
jgi:hypothetical protein